MTGTAGDAHIWLPTTGDTPLAACGYAPPLVDILSEPAEGEEAVVLGQQVQHAEPTGVTCAECIGAQTPDEPVQATDEPAPKKARAKAKG